MSGDYVLYGRQGGGSVAPQLVLEEMGVPYKIEWVERDAPAQDMVAYRRIAPTGKIPALTLPDGTSIFESAAICMHLASLPGALKMAPESGTSDHARYLQWMVFLAANLYDSVIRYYYAARYTSDPSDSAAEAVKRAALSEFESGLAVIESQLNGETLVETLSAADFYLYMLASWHPDGDGAVSKKFPKVARLCQQIGARPLVKKVMEWNEG